MLTFRVRYLSSYIWRNSNVLYALRIRTLTHTCAEFLFRRTSTPTRRGRGWNQGSSSKEIPTGQSQCRKRSLHPRAGRTHVLFSVSGHRQKQTRRTACTNSHPLSRLFLSTLRIHVIRFRVLDLQVDPPPRRLPLDILCFRIRIMDTDVIHTRSTAELARAMGTRFHVSGRRSSGSDMHRSYASLYPMRRASGSRTRALQTARRS